MTINRKSKQNHPTNLHENFLNPQREASNYIQSSKLTPEAEVHVIIRSKCPIRALNYN